MNYTCYVTVQSGHSVYAKTNGKQKNKLNMAMYFIASENVFRTKSTP